MKSRKARLAAGATVLGLGALGGTALGTNPGFPAAARQAAGGSGTRIVTAASGATTAASQPVGLRTSASARPPIVTRASGASPLPGMEVDD